MTEVSYPASAVTVIGVSTTTGNGTKHSSGGDQQQQQLLAASTNQGPSVVQVPAEMITSSSGILNEHVQAAARLSDGSGE